MAHRGRLNVLANMVGKSPGADVFRVRRRHRSRQYARLGRREVSSGRERRAANRQRAREIVVSVASNPSHLEAVDPVVEGIVRPKQDRLGDTKRERVIPLLIHGDAAFAGQGVVAETLQSFAARRLHHRRHHSPGDQQPDRIHHQSRRGAARRPIAPTSRAWCRRPSSTSTATIRRRASAWRRWPTITARRFKRDVVIDMFCYRRHGHNEADDPSYTQPILYRKIRKHPSVASQYSRASGARRR